MLTMMNRGKAIRSFFRLGRKTICLGVVGVLSLQLGVLSVFAQSPGLMEDNRIAAVDDAAPNKVLKGALTKIYVTRGRSQIVKFAQPIVRVSIAEPSMAEIVPLAPDQIMINGKLRGVTSLIVWDEDGQEGIFDLHIENDTSALMEAVQAVAPNENIQLRVTDDSVILSGQVSNTVILDEIRKTAAGFGFKESDGNFINLAEAPVPQVHLEVKIAEINRSVGRDYRTSFTTDGSKLGLSRLAYPYDSKILESAGRATSGFLPQRLGLPAAPLAQAVSSVGGLTGAYSSGNRTMSWEFLQTSGDIKILAEPTLVATHGREANFLAGGKFPYVKGTDQNGSPLIEFEEYGVKLEFTPWISVRSGRVELKVAPEVSSLDSSNCQTGSGGLLVCGILKRSTSTTVELRDGETLMISGILSREEQNAFQKVPFVGDLPILGAFFKNADMSKSDKELIVIVTPHIVNPSHYGQILGAPQ